MIKTFLLLECVVDVRRDKRVHTVFLIAIAVDWTVDAFTLALWNRFCLGNELLEESDRRIDEGCLAVGDVPIDRAVEEFAQVMEQPPKRRTINEHLQDSICKTHVSSVDETARTNFHSRLGGWSRCQEG